MKSSSWVINAMTRNDLEAAYTIDQQSPSPWTPAQLEGEFFAADGWRLTVREKQHDMIAGFLVARNLVGEAEILRLAVDEHYQRQGLGSRLLNHFLGILAKKKITSCHLELRSANHKARKLYEKSDFVMTGLRKKYYTDPADDAILMTRIIEPCT